MLLTGVGEVPLVFLVVVLGAYEIVDTLMSGRLPFHFDRILSRRCFTSITSLPGSLFSRSGDAGGSGRWSGRERDEAMADRDVSEVVCKEEEEEVSAPC